VSWTPGDPLPSQHFLGAGLRKKLYPQITQMTQIAVEHAQKLLSNGNKEMLLFGSVFGVVPLTTPNLRHLRNLWIKKP
jgi:hypothetical protein